MKQLSYRNLPKVDALPTPSSSLEGVIVELSTDSLPYYCDGSNWSSLVSSQTGLSVNQVSINFGSTETIETVDRSLSKYVSTMPVLFASDNTMGDNFGGSVSLSADGTVLVVGAYGWEGAIGLTRGGVYTYDLTNGFWVQRGSVLEASDAADNDGFGVSTALSADGTVLVVGAYGWEGDVGGNRGSVYTYDLINGFWVQRGSVLEASDAANSDYYGVSTALSADGTVLVVGASNWEGAVGSNRGGVYTYDLIDSNWVQRGAVLEASDAADSDYYGGSVALSADGTVLVVGASNWEGANVDMGGVYTYDLVNGNWAQRGDVLTSGFVDQWSFGTSVSLSGDAKVLVVGMTLYSNVIPYCGVVSIYDLVNNLWVKRSDLFAFDAAESDNFGIDVSLSADGSALVVGASSWEDLSTASDIGGVYTYSLIGEKVTKTVNHRPEYSKRIEVSDPSVTTSSKIIINPSPDSDEYECQTLSCSAYCATNGVITVFITSDAPLYGTYKFQYMVI